MEVKCNYLTMLRTPGLKPDKWKRREIGLDFRIAEVSGLGTIKCYCRWCGRRYLMSVKEIKNAVCPNCGKKGTIYTVTTESK